jgi:hypothetical protein
MGELEFGNSRPPQNYPLQLSSAIIRVAIAVRPLGVQQQSALWRAFKQAACS